MVGALADQLSVPAWALLDLPAAVDPMLGALAETIGLYATGAVDPRLLVGATVGLEAAADVLAGHRRGAAPKIPIDPSLR